MNGIELIAAERQRQITEKGYTADHDEHHCDGELALAAVCYASPKRLYIKTEYSGDRIRHLRKSLIPLCDWLSSIVHFLVMPAIFDG